MSASARALLLMLALSAPSLVEAQTRTPAPARTQPPPARPRLGLRGYITYGSATPTARETFDAIAGTRHRAAFGGGVQVTNVWKAVFAEVGASQLSLDGERVFVSDGRVFRLGIPLEVTIRPVDIAGGWRLRLARGRVSPYLGAGVTFLRYEETSRFAQRGEDVEETKAGPMVLGGVDLQVWRWIHAGGEIRYRRVRGILGEGGASAEFDEDDAGGVAVALRVSIGR